MGHDSQSKVHRCAIAVFRRDVAHCWGKGTSSLLVEAKVLSSFAYRIMFRDGTVAPGACWGRPSKHTAPKPPCKTTEVFWQRLPHGDPRGLLFLAVWLQPSLKRSRIVVSLALGRVPWAVPMWLSCTCISRGALKYVARLAVSYFKCSD